MNEDEIIVSKLFVKPLILVKKFGNKKILKRTMVSTLNIVEGKSKKYSLSVFCEYVPKNNKIPTFQFLKFQYEIETLFQSLSLWGNITLEGCAEKIMFLENPSQFHTSNPLSNFVAFSWNNLVYTVPNMNVMIECSQIAILKLNL